MKSYTLEFANSGEIIEEYFASEQQAYEWAAWVLDRRGYDASELTVGDWDADGINDDGEQCYRMLYWATEAESVDDDGQKSIAQLCK